MAVPEISIASVAKELNSRAYSYRIGNLPEIRKSLTGFAANKIFDSRSTFSDYAFHVGGRKGLQFNIGIDGLDDSEFNELRYGVAFSFQVGRNLPTIEPLLPKVARFNEFFRLYPERFENIKTWYWDKNGRSADLPATPIQPEWVEAKNFIFYGQRQPFDSVNYDTILSLFDQMLPIYKYTEGGADAYPIEGPMEKEFEFQPGFTARADHAVSTQTARHLDINLRHNVLQDRLYRQLVSQHGKANVGAEILNGVGGLMDVAVKTSDGLCIYEIKTGKSARGCIREAMGQLLEYALWPGAPKSVKLIVVGEGNFDDTTAAYLNRLNERFPLPISYKQITIVE